MCITCATSVPLRALRAYSWIMDVCSANHDRLFDLIANEPPHVWEGIISRRPNVMGLVLWGIPIPLGLEEYRFDIRPALRPAILLSATSPDYKTDGDGSRARGEYWNYDPSNRIWRCLFNSSPPPVKKESSPALDYREKSISSSTRHVSLADVGQFVVDTFENNPGVSNIKVVRDLRGKFTVEVKWQ